MRKRFSILLVALLLPSCGSNNAVKILSPTGAPSLAFYNFSEYHYFETNSVPTNVISAISNTSSYALVVAPTQGGIQAINREIKESGSSSFKIASIVTFGNFYLASTGNDTNESFDENDSLVLFGKGELPDKLFQNVYSDLYTKLLNNGNIYYVNAVNNAASALISGTIPSETGGMQKINYVLIAEPALSNALNKNPKAKIYSDIQNLYQAKGEECLITQASIFVNTRFGKSTIDSLLNKIENDIVSGINNPQLISDGLSKYPKDQVTTIFGIPSIELVIKVIQDGNRINLGYKNAYQNKKQIDHFLKDIAPNIGDTNEEIYYK